jgi:LysM repeat protein
MNDDSRRSFSWSLPLLASVSVHVVVLWAAVAWLGPSDEPEEQETVEQSGKPRPVEEPKAADGGASEPVRSDMPENRPPSSPPEAHAAPGAVSNVATSSPPAAGTIVYEVKPGDNLTRIAKKHKCTVSEILKLNKMKPNKVLWVGLKLKIPAPVE